MKIKKQHMYEHRKNILLIRNMSKGYVKHAFESWKIAANVGLYLH